MIIFMSRSVRKCLVVNVMYLLPLFQCCIEADDRSDGNCFACLFIPQDVNVLVGHQYYKTDMEFLIERQRRGSP